MQVIDFYPQESQILLPCFIAEGKTFDFAFVDGSHLFDKVFVDLILLGQLVKPEGIIFADDYDAKAVAKAISFCVKNLKWKVEELSPRSRGHRWAVLRTPKKPIARSYPHFVNF